MRKIYLIRHGQSESNAGGAPQLNQGIKLTDLGHRQAQVVSDWVIENIGTDIASIGVSKFIRTQQTAAPLVAVTEIQPTIIEGLEEFDYVSLEIVQEKSLAECRRVFDDYWARQDVDYQYGVDAESFSMFYNRVAQVMSYFEQLEAGNHIVYTHGLWISMLIWQILGQPATRKRHMRKFRQFEMSIRARNCEVFCLTLADEMSQLHPPTITKVRARIGAIT